MNVNQGLNRIASLVEKESFQGVNTSFLKSSNKEKWKGERRGNVYATVFYPEIKGAFLNQTVLFKGCLGQVGLIWSAPWTLPKSKLDNGAGWGPIWLPEGFGQKSLGMDFWVESNQAGREKKRQSASRVKFICQVLYPQHPSGGLVDRVSEGVSLVECDYSKKNIPGLFQLEPFTRVGNSLEKNQVSFQDLNSEANDIWEAFGQVRVQSDSGNNQRKQKSKEKSASGGFKDRVPVPKKVEWCIKKRIKNYITGITQGFSTNLELRGIGFKAKKEIVSLTPSSGMTAGSIKARHMVSEVLGKIRTPGLFGVQKDRVTQFKGGQRVSTKLNFKLGFSHNLIYTAGGDQSVKLDIMQGSTPSVSAFGITASTVNQVAYEIYSYKKPEPYKGKGIRYKGEKFFGKKGRGKD